MYTILTVTGHQKDYPIYVIQSESLLPTLQKYIQSKTRIYVLIDASVVSLYTPTLTKLQTKNDITIIEVVALEKNKSWEKLEEVLKVIHATQPTQDSVVIGIGGGLVLNLAGMISGLMMRGMPYISIPTTITAQIDACIGSKQAINFAGSKNWVGLYFDPITCLIDPHVVNHMNSYQSRSQWTEAIKLLLCEDYGLLKKMEDDLEIGNADIEKIYSEWIICLLKLKIQLLKQDLYEHGRAASLLYGHELAHALESVSNGSISHGEAVGVGMIFASVIAERCIDQYPHAYTILHKNLIEKLGLMTVIPSHISIEKLMQQLVYNKKNTSADSVSFVLIEKPGTLYLDKESQSYYKSISLNIVSQCLVLMYEEKP